MWEVEFTDEFGEWWNELTEAQQGKVDAAVRLLEEHGPDLGFPLSSGVAASRYSEMRELRVQARGQPLRILYAFDPRRVVLLLLGGNKTGNPRWYVENVPQADRIFEQHLKALPKEKKRGKKV